MKESDLSIIIEAEEYHMIIWDLNTYNKTTMHTTFTLNNKMQKDKKKIKIKDRSNLSVYVRKIGQDS